MWVSEWVHQSPDGVVRFSHEEVMEYLRREIEEVESEEEDEEESDEEEDNDEGEDEDEVVSTPQKRKRKRELLFADVWKELMVLG